MTLIINNNLFQQVFNLLKWGTNESIKIITG